MKINIILLIILTLLTFSCKRESTCTCTQVYTEPAYSYNGQYHEAYIYYSTFTNTIKTKKKEAVSTCRKSESINSSPSTHYAQGQGPTTTIITCEVL